MGLLRQLHEVEFYSLVPNDDNRGRDGLDLRASFELDYGKLKFDSACTVLEMLVGVAKRMSYILCDPETDEDDTPLYFWEFMENLGLDSENSTRNERVIRRFLERQYSYNGTGGIFPVRQPEDDQRTVEIWYQMMGYVSEKHYAI